MMHRLLQTNLSGQIHRNRPCKLDCPTAFKHYKWTEQQQAEACCKAYTSRLMPFPLSQPWSCLNSLSIVPNLLVLLYGKGEWLRTEYCWHFKGHLTASVFFNNKYGSPLYLGGVLVYIEPAIFSSDAVVRYGQHLLWQTQHPVTDVLIPSQIPELISFVYFFGTNQSCPESCILQFLSFERFRFDSSFGLV